MECSACMFQCLLFFRKMLLTYSTDDPLTITDFTADVFWQLFKISNMLCSVDHS